jgi:hypothetical protein
MPPRRYEKEEKHEKAEKEEKREKGEKHEDRTGPIVGGLILILLGVTFFLAQAGVLAWRHWWGYFLLGIGIVLLILAALRFGTTTYRGPVTAPLIGGLVLVFIGIAAIADISRWWPLAIIGLGIAVVVSALSTYRRTPMPR